MLNIKVSPTFEDLGVRFSSIDLSKVLRETGQEVAFAIESYAKQVTPVKTGRLRASIGVSIGFGLNFNAFVQPNVNYAFAVHEGTKWMRARPFMKWGVEFAEKKFTGEEIGWRIDKELRKKLIKL